MCIKDCMENGLQFVKSLVHFENVHSFDVSIRLETLKKDYQKVDLHPMPLVSVSLRQCQSYKANP